MLIVCGRGPSLPNFCPGSALAPRLHQRTEDGTIEAGIEGEGADGEADGNRPAREARPSLTVLILEDETLTGMLLAQAVSDRGCAVCGPHLHPDEALYAVAARLPDAALLDVSLGPDTTSLPVADALAKRGVPFAFVTGYGPETAAVVSAHPGHLVIPKPVDPETLSMLLDELLPPAADRAKGAA